MRKRYSTIILIAALVLGCRDQPVKTTPPPREATQIQYAKGFDLTPLDGGGQLLTVYSPWPESPGALRYALIPKDQTQAHQLTHNDYDAVIEIPVERLVVTSTTHIPVLEALNVADRLVGFPQTEYISSPKTRKRIAEGRIEELGRNENLNTELTILLDPDVLIGFGIDGQNRAYGRLQDSGIPVMYNGDWTEESPLGKAEWIKFFAPLFGMEAKADSIFRHVEQEYSKARSLGAKVVNKPLVLSGALYQDIWYLPGGKSWAAKFIEDAGATYLWEDTEATGSLSLSLESVIQRGIGADFWISPSQFTSYEELSQANEHYTQFKAFKNRRVFTTARTKGSTGGLLFYEIGPSRPDIILKDLIRIFHPDLLPEYNPYFFKPLL